VRGSSPVHALVDATCEVLPGDRIAVVGPSGSGKSTLMHLMAGLDEPTSGEVSWPLLGIRETLIPREIGFVFQSPSLLSPLNVLENIELPLLLSGASQVEARSAALELLQDMELSEIGEKLPEELSGGQAQRVAVARSLVTRPKLILADEPTGQLDHPTAQHLFDVLLASMAKSDTALVIATHDAAVAGRMDRGWDMEHGKLET
jgi:ABC-type lipoprotein export system ATPase subunit